MATVDELIAEAKPREVTVEVCLDGALLAEHDRAEEQLRRAVSGGVETTSLSGVHPSVELAARVRELEADIRAKARTWRFRGLPPWQYRQLIDAHPADKPGHRWSTVTFPPVLIAACCVEPVTFTSAEDVRRLLERCTSGVQDQLFTAAYQANEGGGDVPKSELASAATPTTGPSSTQQPAGE